MGKEFILASRYAPDGSYAWLTQTLWIDCGELLVTAFDRYGNELYTCLISELDDNPDRGWQIEESDHDCHLSPNDSCDCQRSK